MNRPSKLDNYKFMYQVIFVTVPNKKEAEKIAGSLLKHRLAACVNIIPGITSVYRWKGGIEKSKELLLVIKTSKNKTDNLIKLVKKEHPYDIPEIISLPITKGNKDYLRWISDSIK